uniref:RxLR effector protein n=1 Tax=Spongospora subterranea TaxID=70186 RepID=A0A0H5QNX2_9EUKA|eukprot:CRZ03282.1 hypothetical protein [Spongospora subterranea]
MSSVMAAMIIIYTMFSSWDVAAPIPRPKRRKESVSESTKDVDDSEMQSEESSLPNFNQQAQEKKPANRFLTPFQAFSRQAKKPEKTDSQSTIPASIGQQRRTPVPRRIVAEADGCRLRAWQFQH